MPRATPASTFEIGRRFRCGGIVTGSPKMMVQPCDVILTVQPSAAEVREVAFGWEGLSRGFVRGGVLIDMGSSDPAAHGIPPHLPVHPRTSGDCCLISCSDCRPSMPGMLMSDRMTLTAGSIASLSKFWWPISPAALRVLMGKKSGAPALFEVGIASASVMQRRRQHEAAHHLAAHRDEHDDHPCREEERRPAKPRLPLRVSANNGRRDG